jgi:hypothetical protein
MCLIAIGIAERSQQHNSQRRNIELSHLRLQLLLFAFSVRRRRLHKQQNLHQRHSQHHLQQLVLQAILETALRLQMPRVVQHRSLLLRLLLLLLLLLLLYNNADPSATMAAFAALAARRPELRSYLGSVSAGRFFQLSSRSVLIANWLSSRCFTIVSYIS